MKNLKSEIRNPKPRAGDSVNRQSRESGLVSSFVIRHSSFVIALALLSTLNFQLSTAFAQDTAFTYQGRLNDGANPANGIYDLRFTIYDSTDNPGTIVIQDDETNRTLNQ